MSERSNKYYEDWKERIGKLREEKARQQDEQDGKKNEQNKKQPSEQETKDFKTYSPTSSSEAESKKEHPQTTQQHKNKTLLRIKSFIIGLAQKIAHNVYFLEGEGLLDFVLFMGSSIFYFVLLAAGIALFVLPLCFVLSILLLWLGFKTISNYIALIGIWIVILGAFWGVILYFAELNVRLYKEEHFIEIDKSLCKSGEENE